ncbi:ribonucleoprotein [Candidatus Bathyarchaeota archaeon]|nr:MAG: ribonucleoprotein [Candidatus Bathyarchaeota archaeon]
MAHLLVEIEFLEPSKRPINTLLRNLQQNIIVKLKNNLAYKGRMIRCDNYMNITLEGATEFNNGTLIANYGNVFIRGNNILYINLNTDKLL